MDDVAPYGAYFLLCKTYNRTRDTDIDPLRELTGPS